jgi:hypothetical protein
MEKVCVNASGLLVRVNLLAKMRYAACLSSETPRPHESPFKDRFQARRLTVLSSSLVLCRRRWDRVDVALLCHDSVRDSAVLLTYGEDCPRDTCQLVGHRDDQHVRWCSNLE